MEAVEVVVSDGCLGLPKAMKGKLPNAQQQRCITHKVRGLERYLNYNKLPKTNEQGDKIKPEQAKRQRRFEIQSGAYKIYKAETREQAKQLLQEWIEKWEAIEPKATQIFQQDFELTLTFYQMDQTLHRHIRTTNHLERLFREFCTNLMRLGRFPMRQVA